MFACRRSCVTKKLRQSPVFNSEQPSAPLLFLYPRWFASIPESNGDDQYREGTTGGANSVNRVADLSQPLPGDYLCTAAAARSWKAKSPTETFAGQLLPTDDFHGQPRENPILRRTKQARAHRQSFSYRNRLSVSRIVQKRLERLPRGNVVAGSGPRLVLSKPTFRSSRQAYEYYNTANKEEKDTKRNTKQQNFKPGTINWLPLAKLLSKTPPIFDHARGKEMLLSERLVLEYTGDSQGNMWIHKAGSGCEVHVLPADSENSGFRRVVLHGSPRAKDLTEAYFLHLEEHIRSPASDGMAMEPQAQTHLPAFTSLLTPGGLTLPFVWSVRSFYKQVSLLVDRKVRRLVQKEISHETHNKTIATLLTQYFSDPVSSQHVSTLSLNRALKFICDHSELSATQHLLHTRSKKLGVRLDVNSFNLLIAAALKVNDRARVRSLLWEMKSSRIPPDGVTWASIFAAVRTMTDRRAVLSQMKNAGVMLNSAAKSALARVLVDDRFQSIKDSSEELAAFVKQIDELFGPDWLSSTICNRMLYHSSQYKQWNLAKAILELRADRNLQLDKASSVYLVSLSRRRGNLKSCLSIMRSNLLENQTEMNRFVIPHVFMAAWKHHCYNLCRLLWRYAATHGIISYHMQNVVTSSLLKNTTKSSSANEMWKTRAGKVVIGTELYIKDFDAQFPVLSASAISRNPIEWLSQHTIDDGSRDEQVSLAYVLMYRDLTAWKYFEPMSAADYLNMVEKAYALDLKWNTSGNVKRQPASTIANQAIEVDLIRRRYWKKAPGSKTFEPTSVSLLQDNISSLLRVPADLDSEDQALTSQTSRFQCANLSSIHTSDEANNDQRQNRISLQM